jgi:hypothetical protein
MSESKADNTAELDTIADELYGLRPDEFAAARDEQVRKARGDGQQALARELAKLRRPTQSAWLINLLWRDQREFMEALLELSEELTRAQAEAAGSTLHELTAQRRQLERALIQRARALARDAGVDVSASMEREAQETLGAALADPEVATEVRTGRLVKPAAYAGFGTFGTAPTKSPARSEPARVPAARKPDDFEARAAQRARERREAAERRVAEARSALEAAASALAEEQREAEAARAHGQDLRTQVDQLRERLRELELERATAERAAVAAERSRDQAERAHTAAERALEQAEQDLKALD